MTRADLSRLSCGLSIASLAPSGMQPLRLIPTQQDRAMSLELPSPIADYVAANARLDLEGMITPFAADAVLLDNGKRFVGHREIRNLFKELVVDLKAIFTPDAVRHEKVQVVVEGPAHGDFPGSPVRFTYRFDLDGDAIKAVEITA
ncbi:nuclear transport factor 2 family protein [Brevundimonas sp. PWP3-1b1]|uniref:nuclear transport factor 2 family protein n=2 Tax=Brevundimonas TaxID=41275 RepID=UPI003CF30F49